MLIPANYLLTIASHRLITDDQRRQLLSSIFHGDPAKAPSMLTLDQLLAGLAQIDAVAPRGWHIEACLRLDASQHGAAGMSVLTAATLAQAIESLLAFDSLRAPWALLHAENVPGYRRLVSLPQLPGRGPHELLMEMTVLAQFGLIAQLSPGLEPQLRLHLPNRYRPWENELRRQLRGRLVLGKNRYGIDIPLHALKHSCLLADESLHRAARQRCLDELSRQSGLGPIAAQVRQILIDRAGSTTTLNDLASALGLSRRTLTRRLADEGWDWRSLREQTLKSWAADGLRQGNRPIGEIAEQLGYSDLANFHRAFRRWWGCSPSRFRHQAAKPDDPQGTAT